MEPAKRQRMEGDEVNGKSKRVKSRNIESVFFDLLKFLSVEDNWNRESIELDLIPSIFKYSKKFQYGEGADLTKIQNANKFQTELFLRIFKNTKKICVDGLMQDNRIFGYLKKYQKLEKLKITIRKLDNFPKHEPILNIKTLIIVAKFRFDENDAIFHTLLKTPQLRTFSLTEGSLTIHSIILMDNFSKLSCVHLTNVRILPENKNILMTLLQRKNLKKLSIITTKQTNVTFNQINNEIFNMFHTTNSTLSSLRFTISQKCRKQPQNFEKLRNLINIKKIRIYYSAQYSIETLKPLIKILNSLPIKNIKFVEYHDLTKTIGLKTLQFKKYIDTLKIRSNTYFNLLSKMCEHAQVIVNYDYENQVGNNMESEIPQPTRSSLNHTHQQPRK